MARVELKNSPSGTCSLPQTLDLDLDSSVCLGQPLALVASSLHLRTPFSFQSEWNVGMVTWNTRSYLLEYVLNCLGPQLHPRSPLLLFALTDSQLLPFLRDHLQQKLLKNTNISWESNVGVLQRQTRNGNKLTITCLHSPSCARTICTSLATRDVSSDNVWPTFGLEECKGAVFLISSRITQAPLGKLSFTF